MLHNFIIRINPTQVAFTAVTILSHRDNAGATYAGLRVNCGGYIMSREAR